MGPQGCRAAEYTGLEAGLQRLSEMLPPPAPPPPALPSVVLATSEYSFIRWISDGILTLLGGFINWTPEGISCRTYEGEHACTSQEVFFFSAVS